MMQTILSEREMRVIEQARAESRKEVAALERMKRDVRSTLLGNAVMTNAEFERLWPQLCSEILSQQAHQA